MTLFKRIFVTAMCLLVAFCTPLCAAAQRSDTVTFVIDTVQEADFVVVNMSLTEANTYIGALEIQFSYDSNYLEIVENPDVDTVADPENKRFFVCPFDYKKNGILYAANEKNMKYALASARGVQNNGQFLTLCFRVIRDIPAGKLAEITGKIGLITDNDSQQYQSATIVSGGVMGTDYKPTNKLFTNQRTGIEAITTEDNAVSDADFRTRVHGKGGNQVVYDLAFTEGGAEVQPDETVVVRIPLPENFDKEQSTVYHTEDDGTQKEVPVLVHGDYLVVEAEHFSHYTVVDPTKPQGEFVLAPALAYGDLNNDGAVSANDALLILKSIVGKVQLDQDQQAAAKVDLDEVISSQDALLVLKVTVNKIKLFPVEE